MADVGILMPGPNHTMMLRTRPGLLLKVAVVAWLSIMAMPCTVLAASPTYVDLPVAETSQPDCHGTHADAESTASNCCCDLLSVTGGEAPKNQRVDLVAVSPLAHSLVPTFSFATVIFRAHPPPQADAEPPVYLTTQRFRI